MKLAELLSEYLRHLKALGRASYTLRNIRNLLLRFLGYLEEEGVTDAGELTAEVIEEYQQELAFSFTSKGTPLSLRSQQKALCTVKGFTRYLHEKDYLLSDPGRKIKLPKQPKYLPRSILSTEEIDQIMTAPNMRTLLGYRDRLVLEVLYDTAVRRSEVAHIRLTDLDLEEGFIRVQGKGDKERIVPVSRKVCELIKTYLIGIRPELAREKDQDTGWLFLNDKGDRIHLHTIWTLVKRSAKKADLTKNVTPHTFRHTCVTHMLRNGAPIRHLQEMLGHESLETTQIYTRVTINDLKEVHRKYHPSEQMKED